MVPVPFWRMQICGQTYINTGDDPSEIAEMARIMYVSASDRAAMEAEQAIKDAEAAALEAVRIAALPPMTTDQVANYLQDREVGHEHAGHQIPAMPAAELARAIVRAGIESTRFMHPRSVLFGGYYLKHREEGWELPDTRTVRDALIASRTSTHPLPNGIHPTSQMILRPDGRVVMAEETRDSWATPTYAVRWLKAKFLNPRLPSEVVLEIASKLARRPT